MITTGLVPARPEEQEIHARLLSDSHLAWEGLGRRDTRLKQGLAALTPAERIVAFQLKFGLSNKEVCAQLGKSEATVKNQVASLLRKLDVPSRARLVALLWALDLASQPQAETIVVCGSSVRRAATENCSVGRAAARLRCRADSTRPTPAIA